MELRYLFLLACPIGMGLMMWMMSRNTSSAPGADLSDLTPEQRLGLLEQRSLQVARELAAARDPSTGAPAAVSVPSAVPSTPTKP